MQLKLKDGTKLEIGENSNEYCFSLVVSNPKEAEEIMNNLTDENLSEFRYIEAEGLYSIIKNKTFSKMQLEHEVDIETMEITGNFIVTFVLADIDILAKKIKYLEETVDVLVLASLS